MPQDGPKKKDFDGSEVLDGFGGAKRDRTADLNTASVALSQLSYSPGNWKLYYQMEWMRLRVHSPKRRLGILVSAPWPVNREARPGEARTVDRALC